MKSRIVLNYNIKVVKKVTKMFKISKTSCKKNSCMKTYYFLDLYKDADRLSRLKYFFENTLYVF